MPGSGSHASSPLSSDWLTKKTLEVDTHRCLEYGEMDKAETDLIDALRTSWIAPD